MSPAAPKMRASELLERLRRHFIKPGEDLPGGVFLPEVALAGRRADALYVGFTSTRGHHLTGFELKVTRSDWLHELDEAHKADVWASQCHAWYAVAPSAEIIRVEELPAGWGLMVPNARTKTRMDVLVKADLHPEREPSWRAVHEILKKLDTERASMVRAAASKAFSAAYEQGRAAVEEAEALRARSLGDDHIRKQNQRLRDRLAAIEGLLGLHLVEDEAYVWREGVLRDREVRELFLEFLAAGANVTRALDDRRGLISTARSHLKTLDRSLAQALDLLAAAGVVER